MKFWQFPQQFQQNTAVITESESLTYSELQQRCVDFKPELPEEGSLVGLLCKNDLNTLVAWLACLNKGIPVLLLDANAPPQSIENLVQNFALVALIRDGVVTSCQRDCDSGDNMPGNAVDSRLAVMISTSGSTGSAKQVALSYDNLQANAESICAYLPIQPDDVTITTLPFHYSYGLSVIHTHLLSGAAIVLSDYSIMSREFWNLVSEQQITSLAGVPYTYEMLKRLGFLKKEFPSLRYLTQAGGRLADDIIVEFANYMRERNHRFYVMYGQTEATARMAWLEPDKLPQKTGSIGSAIPGGRLVLLDEHKHPVQETNTQGELVYYGENIMLGYACEAKDLKRFSPVTELFTGDLATRDDDGDYFITGRVKRIVKIFGSRINLDEVEALLEKQGYHSRVTGTDKYLYLAFQNSNIEGQQEYQQEVRQFLSKSIKLHPSVIRCKSLESYPLKANQKTDYTALLAVFEGEANHV